MQFPKHFSSCLTHNINIDDFRLFPVIFKSHSKLYHNWIWFCCEGGLRGDKLFQAISTPQIILLHERTRALGVSIQFI